MRWSAAILLSLLLCLASANAQVQSSVTGPKALPFSGKVDYHLHFSQNAEFGSNFGDWQTSTASATAEYTNTSQRYPFTLNYSGGYTWTLTGPDYSTGLFQHLFLSQSIEWGKWNLLGSDDVSYLPQAPTTGFSGIPGVGEAIGVPTPAPPSGQSILTLHTHVVDNNAAANLSRRIGGANAITIGGSSYLLRYPDANGIDTDAYNGNAAVTHRFDSRDSVSEKYIFARFSYPAAGFTFDTHTGLIDFTRSWNRKITTDLAAGPEWTQSSVGAAVPSSLSPSVTASLTYQFRTISANLICSMATSGGAGYLIGAKVDTATAALSREFGRNLSLGLNGSYMRTAGLQLNGITSSKYGGIQLTRMIGPQISFFANYTAIDQSTSSALPGNTLSGLMQMASVGISYGSREVHVGH
jgi:hypothetical protein